LRGSPPRLPAFALLGLGCVTYQQGTRLALIALWDAEHTGEMSFVGRLALIAPLRLPRAGLQ
jgi:hypothetical protein